MGFCPSQKNSNFEATIIIHMMKRILFSLVVLMAFVGCHRINPEPEPEPTPDPQPELSPDSTYVSLKAALDFTEEPLTKAGSQDDLYGIRVYQLSPSGPIATDYGTFDDLGTAVIKMAKAYKYGIDVTYIPNGKNLVHKYSEGYYGVPFDDGYNPNHGSLNQVMYISNIEQPLHPLYYGSVQEKGITESGIEYNNWSTVTRYQGIAICNPAEQSSIEVKMYAQMIGFRVSISDFESGKVTIGGQYGHRYSATPDANKNGLIDIVVCLESMPSVSEEFYIYSQEDIDPVEYINNKERNQTVQLTYTDTNNTNTILYLNTNFSAKRNTRYIMSFSLSDAIRNGGITASTVNEGEMTESGFPF